MFYKLILLEALESSFIYVFQVTCLLFSSILKFCYNYKISNELSLRKIKQLHIYK